MRRTTLVLVVVLALVMHAVPASAASPSLRVRTVQSGLTVPWDVAFAPSGEMLVTERPGRIRVYESHALGARLVHTRTVADVRAEGESGLMGIAVTRKVGKTMVFTCASRQVDGEWRNQVLRWYLRADSTLRFDRVIVDGMRANSNHDGCPVEVGPDGKVWIGMGDAGDVTLAQDRRSLNGKILRVNTDGSLPGDNPFRGSRVYALGLRNPQGIAFRPDGRAYFIEHGPDRDDEINLSYPGGNYGWPCYTGMRNQGPRSSGCGSAGDYLGPTWTSGSPTLATSGAAFVTGPNWQSWRGDLFVANLKESDLRRFELNRTGGTLYQRNVRYDDRFGRLRGVIKGPGRNHALFITTSNGSEDRVLRVRAVD